ncbi:hypothetical protein [Aquabacterium humicola]|uniref:hypothetical protein n=1 Tax=Aquabacterium humicola TaxID=3237377 RepID=UPI00254308E8|nr:hypothetical protein [Rubrivivax pictus]
MRDPPSPALFEFESRDSLAQFSVWLLPVVGGGTLSILLWQFGGLPAVIATALVCISLVAGLRASIAVYPNRVEIVRKWFFLPYKKYSGQLIEDVSYGGDWGLDEGAIGVVVRLDGRDIHIGTAKNMHYLHDAISRVAYSGRSIEA